MDKADLFLHVWHTWMAAIYFSIGLLMNLVYKGVIKKIACILFGPFLLFRSIISIIWLATHLLFKPLEFLLSAVFFLGEYSNNKKSTQIIKGGKMNKEDLLMLIFPGTILFHFLRFLLLAVFFLEAVYLDCRGRKEAFRI